MSKKNLTLIIYLVLYEYQQTRREENFLNMTKVINEKPAAYIILNAERLKAFPLRSETRQGWSLCQFYSNQSN